MKCFSSSAVPVLLLALGVGCTEKRPADNPPPGGTLSLQERVDRRLAESLTDQELEEVRAVLGEGAVEKKVSVRVALGKIDLEISLAHSNSDFERLGRTPEARLQHKKHLARLLEIREKLLGPGNSVGDARALMARLDAEREEKEITSKLARRLTDDERATVNLVLGADAVQEGATVGDAVAKLAMKGGLLLSDTPRTPEERQNARENPDEWDRRRLSHLKLLEDLQQKLLNRQ
jgi:hypothetical protein